MDQNICRSRSSLGHYKFKHALPCCHLLWGPHVQKQETMADEEWLKDPREKLPWMQAPYCFCWGSGWHSILQQVTLACSCNPEKQLHGEPCGKRSWSCECGQCPAFWQEISQCSKLNHYAWQCPPRGQSRVRRPHLVGGKLQQRLSSGESNSGGKKKGKQATPQGKCYSCDKHVNSRLIFCEREQPLVRLFCYNTVYSSPGPFSDS